MTQRLLLAALIAPSITLHAQIGWIAPEGKIINYRTLVKEDYLGKPDKRTPNVSSFIVPALYYTADSPERTSNDRVAYKFKVKCAFQSHSWVNVETEEGFRHQQNHYDMALTFSTLLKMQLNAKKDYAIATANTELDAIHDAVYKKSVKVSDDYQRETREGNDGVMERLWDLRVKKCYENATDEYFYSPESALQSVKIHGTVVKRLPDEPWRVFATRCRPLYTWYTDEMAGKTIETTEWGSEKAVIAFYTQNYNSENIGGKNKNNTRIMAYAFMPIANGMYKRIFIDTFTNDEKPVKINAVFFANTDSDAAKELVILTSATVYGKETSGTLYATNVYDHLQKPYPAKAKSLDDIASKIPGGMDGTEANKPTKPKCKSEQEVRDALKKLGLG